MGVLSINILYKLAFTFTLLLFCLKLLLLIIMCLKHRLKQSYNTLQLEIGADPKCFLCFKLAILLQHGRLVADRAGHTFFLACTNKFICRSFAVHR